MFTLQFLIYLNVFIPFMIIRLTKYKLDKNNHWSYLPFFFKFYEGIMREKLLDMPLTINHYFTKCTLTNESLHSMYSIFTTFKIIINYN